MIRARCEAAANPFADMKRGEAISQLREANKKIENLEALRAQDKERLADLVDRMDGLQHDMLGLASSMAEVIIAKLQERLTFPTVEDVERIRDHVSPNGVAFRNGAIAGREEAETEVVKYLRETGFVGAAASIESGFHRT